MKSIAIKDLSENFFEVIGKEWMLVTAGSKEHFNTMTASWGGIGWLWNKPVVFVFIRSERYTYEFMEENEYFTLSFLGKENRSIYNLCGSKSGREVDKVKETGLNPIVTERGNILFEQDRLGLECRKLFITDMKEELFVHCIDVAVQRMIARFILINEADGFGGIAVCTQNDLEECFGHCNLVLLADSAVTLVIENRTAYNVYLAFFLCPTAA